MAAGPRVAGTRDAHQLLDTIVEVQRREVVALYPCELIDEPWESRIVDTDGMTRIWEVRMRLTLARRSWSWSSGVTTPESCLALTNGATIEVRHGRRPR
jgi:hypothetical protein